MNLTLSQIAELVHGQLCGDAQLKIRGAETLPAARAGDLTLVDDPKLVKKLEKCQASAVLVTPDVAPTSLPYVVVEDVREAFAMVINYLRPPRATKKIGISPDAYVSSSAKIGDDVDIHPDATVGDDVEIATGATIHSGVRLLPGCRIGENVTIFPNAVLYDDTLVGARSVIHACAVLGCHGFGFDTVEGEHKLGAQLGFVEIGEDVEIGAGTTIDRGSYGATYVGDGSKIDNQVMIGHNGRIGRHNILCSQIGLAGSCTTGDYVVMGGQVGIRDHIHIGDQVMIGAKSGVGRNLTGPDKYLGTPARPIRQQMQIMFSEEKLPELCKQVKQLQARIDELESKESAGKPHSDAA